MPTRWPAFHGGILLAALIASMALLPTIGWPGHLLVPLAAYLAVALLVPPLRRSIPPLRVGSYGMHDIAIAVVLSGTSASALLAYEALFQPDLTSLAAALPLAAFGSVVLAGICISVGNAVLEELIFRWNLYEAFAAEWGAFWAVLITGAVFGAGHMNGFPPGPVGVFLAGGYGVLLGWLRWRTGGLALCIACHIVADATIFIILVAARVHAPLSRRG